MNRRVGRKLDTAVSVARFCRAHPLPDAGLGAALTRLDTGIGRLQSLAGEQIVGAASRRASAMSREDIRRRLRDALRHLVTVAQAAAADHPELTGMFRIPPSAASHRAFQTSARQMLEAAVGHGALLAGYGLSERLLVDLAAAVDELDASIVETNRGCQQHVAARAGLEVTTREVMRAIRTIDGIYRYLLRHEGPLLAAWASARHVVAERRSETEDEAGPSEPRADETTDRPATKRAG